MKKALLFGYGVRGKNIWIPALIASAEVSEIWVVDPDPNLQLKLNFRKKFFTRLLRKRIFFSKTTNNLDDKFDIAIICTKPDNHFEAIKDAEAISKSIFLETPHGKNIEEKNTIIKYCSEKNINLELIENFIFAPWALLSSHLKNKKRFGDLLFLSANNFFVGSHEDNYIKSLSEYKDIEITQKKFKLKGEEFSLKQFAASDEMFGSSVSGRYESPYDHRPVRPGVLVYWFEKCLLNYHFPIRTLSFFSLFITMFGFSLHKVGNFLSNNKSSSIYMVQLREWFIIFSPSFGLVINRNFYRALLARMIGIKGSKNWVMTSVLTLIDKYSK